MPAKIAFDRERLAAFCRTHHIRWLAFFGSAVREDFGPESDVDVLVEFEPGHVPGLQFFAIQDELGELLGRQVDLNTPNGFRSPLRERVLAEAEVAYAEA